MKRFLDSVAYYMLLGRTKGIETDYKKAMHAKREIPVSNCPSIVENMLYASVGVNEQIEQEELASFRVMIEDLDAMALRHENDRIVREKTESRFMKRCRMGIRDGEWCRVDTDGKFWFCNDHYIIDDQEVQYKPVSTEYGDYYAMDRILAANGNFYDMNYDKVKVQRIGGILPWDQASMVGTET